MIRTHIFRLRKPLPGLLAAILLPGVVPLAAQQSSYHQSGDQLVRQVQGSVATPLPVQVRVVSQLGNVRLNPTSGNTLHYDITLSTKNATGARARLDRLPVQVQRQGDVILVSANGSSTSRLGITVGIPSNAREVRVENAVGNITSGDLAVPLHLETAAGNVSIGHVHANTWAASAGGNITVGGVTGELHARTAGGNVTVGDSAGNSVIETQGGNIDVGEVRGMLQLATGGGTIHVKRATGDVRAETGGGNIQLGSIDGAANARTGGGNIEIERARSVSAETGGGSIRIAAVAGPVTAQTGAGRVHVGIVAASGRFGDSKIESGVGDITVLLPAQLATTVSAELTAPMGHAITGDFPGLNATPHGSLPMHVEAALNGGGPRLHIASNGGDIVIRKQTDAAMRSAVDWKLGAAQPFGH